MGTVLFRYELVTSFRFSTISAESVTYVQNSSSPHRWFTAATPIHRRIGFSAVHDLNSDSIPHRVQATGENTSISSQNQWQLRNHTFSAHIFISLPQPVLQTLFCSDSQIGDNHQHPYHQTCYSWCEVQ